MSKITGRPISVTIEGKTFDINPDVLPSMKTLPDELYEKIGKQMSIDFIYDDGKRYRVISKVEKIFEV